MHCNQSQTCFSPPSPLGEVFADFSAVPQRTLFGHIRRCRRDFAGGECSDPTGTRTCTYHLEDAGDPTEFPPQLWTMWQNRHPWSTRLPFFLAALNVSQKEHDSGCPTFLDTHSKRGCLDTCGFSMCKPGLGPSLCFCLQPFETSRVACWTKFVLFLGTERAFFGLQVLLLGK